MERGWILKLNLIAVHDRTLGLSSYSFAKKCSEPHLAGVNLAAVDVREVVFMAVAAILWNTQDFVAS